MPTMKRTALQEIRDLLAIAVMLVILKSLLFGDAPLKTVLHQLTTREAVAAESISRNDAPEFTEPIAANTINNEAVQAYKDHLAYLEQVLEAAQVDHPEQYAGATTQ
jgi:hypothetical protein